MKFFSRPERLSSDRGRVWGHFHELRHEGVRQIPDSSPEPVANMFEIIRAVAGKPSDPVEFNLRAYAYTSRQKNNASQYKDNAKYGLYSIGNGLSGEGMPEPGQKTEEAIYSKSSALISSAAFDEVERNDDIRFALQNLAGYESQVFKEKGISLLRALRALDLEDERSIATVRTAVEGSPEMREALILLLEGCSVTNTSLNEHLDTLG